jgi:glycosyltransferase involved in cell wall biosynthesis
VASRIPSTIPISVVIPVYNRGDLIRRAIDSVLGQRYAPTEIVVVDDGSTDRTRQAVEGYGKTVRYVFQANSGVSASRNRGVREANFEWIAFLDSDDCWLPHHLWRIANAIEATHGEAGFYFSDVRRPQKEGGNSHWHLSGLKICREFEFRRDAGDWALARVQPMMLQASVIRRKSYLEVGGLPEQLRTREDTLLFFKLALLYPACAVSGCGTVMNSDDDIRLTKVYDEESLVFWDATIFLYRDVLRSVTNISRKRRQFLIESLSTSYVCFGRVLFRRKNYVIAIRNLCCSCVMSPSVFAKECLGSLARNLLKASRGSDSPAAGSTGNA